MARDKKKPGGAPDKTAAEYYELKSDAVNELINANVTNTAEVSKKELNKYRRKSLLNMPEGIKYFLLKWWFAGVVCWFFLIGLGSYGIQTTDMILIMVLVSTALVITLPIYRKWIRKIKTSIEVAENAEMEAIDISGE